MPKRQASDNILAPVSAKKRKAYEKLRKKMEKLQKKVLELSASEGSSESENSEYNGRNNLVVTNAEVHFSAHRDDLSNGTPTLVVNSPIGSSPRTQSYEREDPNEIREVSVEEEAINSQSEFFLFIWTRPNCNKCQRGTCARKNCSALESYD